MIDPHRIRAFAVVAETGSIRRAAALLDLSPANVSRAVARLEAEVGHALFVPSGRGIAITAEGRALHERAVRVLGELEAFGASLRRRPRAPMSEPLRVGTFELFSTHFLAWAMEQVFPGRPMVVRELLPAAIEDALVADEIDYGITYLPAPRDGLDHLRVARQTLAIFGRADVFGATPFDELPFFVPIDGAPRTVLATVPLDGWPTDGPPRKIRAYVQMFETALAACSRGLGVLFAPPFVVRLFNERTAPGHALVALPAPKGLGQVRFNVYLVKRATTDEGRDAKLLAKALRVRCATST